MKLTVKLIGMRLPSEPNRHRHTMVGLLLLTGFWASASLAAPTAAAVLQLVDMSQHKTAKLDQGEIIAHEIPEASDKELAMSVAIYLPVSLEHIVNFLKNGDLLSVDPNITAHADISSDVDDFSGLTFSDQHPDEALDLLNAEAGDYFNLSTEEIAGFAALKTTLSAADKSAVSEIVTQKYRETLLNRYLAYRQQGLAGITAYAREDGVTDPAAELHASAANNQVLKQLFPELYQGWIQYPKAMPEGVEEHFYWVNREVENRPTAILGHRILQTTPSGALIVAREFYVGHSYNASQLIVGALPYRAGTLVFYGHRTSTDQVAGVASSLRHHIGREQMKAQMITRLKNLSKKLQTTAKPPGP
jgi:hypothetical protein